MKKTFIWVLFALLSGLILGRMTFSFYEKVDTKNVISYDNYVYLLKYGKYKDLDEMSNKITDFDRYVYLKKVDGYYAYVAISKTEDNINKIKKIYDSKNIKLKISREKIDNEEFIQNLNEYEKLLSATEEENSLLIIEKQIISCFEKMVMSDE